jgi:hypothetical protein
MFGSIGRSFQLVKVCLHVLAVDKELIVFPLLSFIGLVAVMLSFAGIGIGVGSLDRIGAATGVESVKTIDYVVGFGFYFVSYFVIIFFNCALVYAAHFRLAGGDPNIRTGLNGAMKHIPAIALWALVSAVVGLILKILSNQSRQRGGMGAIVGQIIVGLMGAAWTMVTYFVVPLIVIEGRGFTDSFRGSLSLFRRTWGEQVVGNFGLGLAAMVAFLVTGLALAALFFVFSMLGTIGIGVWFLIAIPTIGILALVFAALDGIYKAALYVFASTGEVPSLFPAEVVREGFREDTRGGSIGGPGGRF